MKHSATAALVFAALGLVVPGIAHAGPPSAGNSTLPVIIYLGGTNAGAPDPADAFIVTVRDLANVVVPGSFVEVRFGGCSDLFPAAVQPLGQTVDCGNRIVSTFAGTDGVAHMNIVGSAFNTTPSGLAPCAAVWADGVYLGDVRVAAWDLDGFDGVDLNDIERWANDFFLALAAQRSDYDGSGVIGAFDLSLLLCKLMSGVQPQSGPHCDGSPNSTTYLSEGQANLYWDDCDNTSTAATFACNTNVASHELMVTFVTPPSGITALSAFDVTIGMTAASSSALPAWWQFENTSVGSCAATALCRPAALSLSTDFSSKSGACLELPLPGVLMDAAQTVGSINPNDGELRVTGVYESPVGPVPSGEHYLVRVIINHAKTTGADVCTGCSEPVCVSLRSARLRQVAPLPSFTLTPVSSLVTWNGAPVGCATATRQSTWGQVKSLYR